MKSIFYDLDATQNKILGNVLGIIDNLFQRTFHTDMLITLERFQGFMEDAKFISVMEAEVCPDKIAYLHLDINSAAAEIGALEVAFDKLVQRGTIVLDNYG